MRVDALVQNTSHANRAMTTNQRDLKDMRPERPERPECKYGRCKPLYNKGGTDPTNTSPMTFKHPRDCQNVV